MVRCCFMVVAMLVATARGQDATALNCQAHLMSMSDSFNRACYADAANCKSGSPSQCSADCAQLWLPFHDQCAAFVEQTLAQVITIPTGARVTPDAGMITALMSVTCRSTRPLNLACCSI
jgi:hypothetical protein